MSAENIGLYASENGDRWSLVKDDATGQPFVRHQANIPSGGASTEVTLPLFLLAGNGPEQQALWALINGLLTKPA
ncbi:hypothetical protein [Chenggangzhangella methanolivorans]|uniref:Uncharacterized protein n=1 Tax=Chenggangzhangella methanolivorans TaxID=1437009 RepID=A0A9E6RCI8_9HYPH|nr:hypothetical protein [Chenggangzhangella methanolivorans]QZO01752.1 hypothetical protein K6K41_10515 [Chenggangzhangella methanolivorans]